MTISELYQQSVKPLSAADRLRLAALILNDIPPQSVVDYSEEWTEEDLADFSRAGWARVDEADQETRHA